MFHVLLTNMVEENIYLNFRLKKKIDEIRNYFMEEIKQKLVRLN